MTRKKTIVKKKAARKAAVKKKATGAIKVSKKEPRVYKIQTFAENEDGLFVPYHLYRPVPAGKLMEGFEKAKSQIKRMTKEIVSTMKQDYIISEIELSASFNADGKFMGFGVGGAATIKIKISPEKK